MIGQILQGSIVKVLTVEVFNDRTMLIDKAKWSYGVLCYDEEQTNETSDTVWNLKWAVNHLRIDRDTIDYIVQWSESVLQLVRLPNEENCVLDKYYNTKK